MSENARRRAAQKGPGEVVTPPEQVRIVRRYLSTLDSLRPGRGPKRAAEAIANRLLKIDEMLISADPVSRLHLTQERIDLDAESIRLGNGAETDVAEMEVEFIKVARIYGDRTGITFSAWRQVGVEADVLEKAGIVRLRKPPPAQAELRLEAPKKPAAPAPAPTPTPAPKAAVRRAGGAPKAEKAPAKKKAAAKKA